MSKTGFIKEKEVDQTELTMEVEKLNKTKFEHVEKQRKRSTYVARSCKEIRDRYEKEGRTSQIVTDAMILHFNHIYYEFVE